MAQKSTSHDVAVIGGSFSGLSAALYLARARRTVAIFDHGRTRNRFSAHGHGFLGMDGLTPDEMRMRGRGDVTAYPTVDLHETSVDAVEPDGDGFRLMTGAGAPVTARRLILACGMRDTLPPIDGLDACWGKTAVHCPYCHGYELADRPTGVLMIGEASLHQVQLLQDWTDRLTLFANGHAVADDMRSELARKAIDIVDDPVVSVEQTDGAVEAVLLAGGRRVPLDVLYLGSQSAPACPFAETLGCAMEDGPFGSLVAIDEMFQTSVSGIYATGDLVRPMFNAVFAAADGAMAGVACHRSLLQ